MEKPLTAFTKRMRKYVGGSREYIIPSCSNCMRRDGNSAAKKWRELHPEKYIEAYTRCSKKPERKARRLVTSRIWASQNRDRKRAYGKKYWGNKTYEWKKDQHLKGVHGIRIHDFFRIKESQNGVCAICKRPEKATFRGKVKELCVDHDHKTGNVRGLLCSNCNRSLGLIEENLDFIKGMSDYVIKYKTTELIS